MWALLEFFFYLFVLAVKLAWKDHDWSLLLTILIVLGIGYLCKALG